MSLVKHIFMKDLRRLRLFLCFWIPVVLIATVAASIQAPANDFALQTTLKVTTVLTAVLQVIMMALIIPLLMHSEPLVGTTAFWLTRPLKKSDVMKAKFVFAGVVFVLIPMLIQLIMLLAHQVPLGYIAPALAERALNQASFTLLLIGFSVLTRNFGFFALVAGIYIAVGLILAVVVQIFQQLQAFEGSGAGIITTDSRMLLSTLVGLLLFSAMIFVQYRYRKISWAYSLLTLEFLLSLWITSFSDIAFFPKPTGTLAAEDAKRIEIALGNRNTNISDSFSMRPNKEKRKELRGNFRYENLPENGFAKARKVHATLEADGLEVGEGSGDGSLSSHFMAKEALAETLAPLEAVFADRHIYHSDRLLKMKESEYIALKGKSGRYSAELEIDVFRYTIAATLPLQVDENFRQGPYNASIASILRETQGCTVIVRERDINPLFKRDRRPTAVTRWSFALANKKKGEAYLPERDNGQQIFQTESSGLSTANKLLRFSSVDKFGTLDGAWLDDAELIIIETEWLGEIQRTYTEDVFSIKGSNQGGPAIIPNTKAKDNIEKLAAIELPDDPSRADVKTYIQKIQNISATQSSFGTRDPQVGMLTDIGAEHLDLLIEASGGRDYYLRRAIENLAAEEHKELILAHLGEHFHLAKSVVKFGWQEEARKTLLDGLKYSEDLPKSWLQSVARFQDPETYPLLTDYLIRARHRDDAYDEIKDLPGIELDEAVAKAWKNAQYDGWERLNTIPLALQFGHKDALSAITIALNDESTHSSWNNKLRKSFSQHTGISGSDEELRIWYLANKDRLRFNPETKMFVVK